MHILQLHVVVSQDSFPNKTLSITLGHIYKVTILKFQTNMLYVVGYCGKKKTNKNFDKTCPSAPGLTNRKAYYRL